MTSQLEDLNERLSSVEVRLGNIEHRLTGSGNSGF